ncbi:hypothetical protein FC093_07990 [Ilyomonas limi]|uniref:HNH endonuclease n=1 Tax=Ilyomonas limi TaxID=2575867 RepID=A0A4U3L4J3_9BACT|nr:hypothetical protein [Ilyomonas limi]TKK69249.1 hypothetical protein FC093_07990 [Ilyomonas limi]
MICEGLGKPTLTFKKRDCDECYIETHHIDQVSNLKQGSLALDNLITVCALHHKQFHYGNLNIIDKAEADCFYFEIDGHTYKTRKLKIRKGN